MNVRAAIAVAVLAPALVACAGPQSALDPAGPAADAIATTWWLMFGTAMAVWAAVMVLVLLAMRRGRGLRPAAGRKMIVVGGALVPTVLLAALLVYGTRTSDLVTGRGSDAELVVRVTARQWQWQFDYLDDEGGTIGSTLDRLALPLGQMVEFRVGSEDVIHSFWIPRLGGKMDAIPGRDNVIRLRADQPGPMRGQCAEFCGLDHATMAFEVVVIDPDELSAWISANAVAAIDPAEGLR
ncbi:cytochrome c oxidase subunit II [Luteimonas aestuarii]|uniref:cytochrome-c oxidase n=1 Tax=Luteimonas aestuarii TaxID=453837 RepID=A0A4R5TLJ9_9GAMM|nr:cytochrome c oxidase subunit II [Luteimonas aestuarii]